MKKRKANKKILKAVDEIQKIYLIVVEGNQIKNKGEKKIIHHLFQDLSDKLLDNI
jgi:hypothetical protein